MVSHSSQNVSPWAIFGLLLMMFLAALDATILSTAMPRIVSLLGQEDLYHWVFTAFMLATTLALPFYGRVADRVGIRPCMLVAGTLFMLGSIICSLAPSMLVLILGRALQGLGASGLQSLPLIAFGLIYTPEERGAKQSLLSMVWGLSSLAGPVAGGYIVSWWSWRWIFGINLPLGIAALGIFWWRFPRHTPHHSQSLDPLSPILLLPALAGFVLLSAGLTPAWQGLGYGMSSLLLLAFAWRQTRVKNPLISPSPFHQPIYRLSCLLGITSYFVGFSALTYVPYYLQMVLHFSPERTGLVLTPMMLAWPISSAIAGWKLNQLGFQFWALMGSGSLVISMGAWTMMSQGFVLPLLELWCIALGMGMGCLTPILLVASQTVVPLKEMGSASTSLVLLRNIGSTLGVSLMGTWLVNFQISANTQSALASIFMCLGAFACLTFLTALLMPHQTPAQLAQQVQNS